MTEDNSLTEQQTQSCKVCFSQSLQLVSRSVCACVCARVHAQGAA